ncbi:hypothetical protein V8G54_035153 [Vigna mungo]|uniref:Uncharacterized protein n=1 Tax=Vigna mungo TaxID=3915 RepID=A0AAQ3MG11_VIGMU
MFICEGFKKRIDRKDKMKIKGVWVIMMIMLVLIGSDYNVLSVKIESKDVSDGLSCNAQCILECSPLAVLLPVYLLCIKDCCKKCCKNRSNVIECTSSCNNVPTGIYLFLYEIIFFIIL